MKYTYSDYLNMAAYIKSKTKMRPRIGIVLGSGLDTIVNRCQIEAVVPYQDIPNHPHPTNKAHKGRFVFASLDGTEILFMQGRLQCRMRSNADSAHEIVGCRKNHPFQCLWRNFLWTGNHDDDQGSHPLQCTQSSDRREYRRIRSKIPGHVRSL